MRYAADVVHHSTKRSEEDRFCTVPIEAANAIEAARIVAKIAATRRYEEGGEVGFLSPQAAPGWYRAAIGAQQRSDDGIATRGVSISIHVWPVD